MRRPLVLALALAFAVPAAAQVPFEDADFEFSITIPGEMDALTREQLEQALGEPAPLWSRDEAPADRAFAHLHMWRDTTDQRRLLRLFLEDNPPPFRRQEEFVAFGEAQGLTIDEQGGLEPPVGPGLRLLGSKPGPDGTPERHILVYFANPAANRYALLDAWAPDASWDRARPAFQDAVESVRFERPVPEGGGGPGGVARNRPGGAGGEASGESWGGLETGGSLVLAAALLLSLFVGGRGT